MTRQERIALHKKQERLQVKSGIPTVHDLNEGVPVLRSTAEGVVEYVRYNDVLYKKVFESGGITANSATFTDDVTLLQGKKIIFDSADTYIYANTDNPEDLVIGADADIILEPDGNVGIGTSTPSAQLHIVGSDVTDQVIIENSDNDAASAPDLVLYRNSSSVGSTDLVGTIYFRGRNEGNSDDIEYASIHTRIYDETLGTEDSELSFNVMDGGIDKQTLALRSGNVGIGTGAPAHKIDVVGTAGLSTGTAWTNTSDERIKENIQPISGGIDKIKALRPVSFNYTDEYLKYHPEISKDRSYNSFIAQEYEQVFPDAVTSDGKLEDNDSVIYSDLKQFNPHDLFMYLVKAVQELSAKVTALENAVR